MASYTFEDFTPEELMDQLYDELLEPSCDLEKVSALIDTGIDLNTSHPLLVAVNSGNLEIVKLLVEKGANVNRFDDDDEETPLFRAMFQKHTDIVEYLEPLTSQELKETAQERLRYNPPCSPN